MDIQIHGNLDLVDEYIVVAPLWAGGLAPAAKTLLKMIPSDKVHLIVTSIGNRVKDRSGYRSVHDITKITGNEDLIIDDLVNSLPNGKA